MQGGGASEPITARTAIAANRPGRTDGSIATRGIAADTQREPRYRRRSSIEIEQRRAAGRVAAIRPGKACAAAHAAL
ncbi:hypothetical protein, partial [Sphingobium sp. Ndbn-10]|uniref:hypothetical protein n=1 Tax=Sphingobium sp. Ndbn-10 TaxID=1667223 RepID=UPI00201E27A0